MVMGFFIGKSEALLGYYEGDRIGAADEEIQRRPDAAHDWDGKQWVKNQQKDTAAKAEKTIEERLAAIEARLGI